MSRVGQPKLPRESSPGTMLRSAGVRVRVASWLWFFLLITLQGGQHARAGPASPLGSAQLLTATDGILWSDRQIFVTSDAGKSWVDKAPLLAGDTSIDSVYFRDGAAGSVLLSNPASDGDGVVIHVGITANAGNSWVIQQLPLTGNDAQMYSGQASVYFQDAVHGWVMLRLIASASFSRGALYRTLDGGETWVRMPAPPAGDPVRFTSAMVGLLAGEPGTEKLYRTQDGGWSWVAEAGAEPPMIQFSLPDTSMSWMLSSGAGCAGSSAVCLLSSSDQGGNWTEITPPAFRIRGSPDQGFDSCAAPAISDLRARWSAPDRSNPFLNMYFGGSNRGCNSRNRDTLTQPWLRQAAAMGWSILPIWVGPQPPNIWPSGEYELIDTDPQVAQEQGATEASKAASAATALGVIPGEILYVDIEGQYRQDPSQRASIHAYVNGWVSQLHGFGFKAGVYGGANSVDDWAGALNPPDAVKTLGSSSSSALTVNWNSVVAVTQAVAPAITSITTSPTPPNAGAVFNFTINGTGIDSTTAQVFFIGPGCFGSNSCVVQNSVLTTKTSTQVAGPAILAEGSFTVQVRNGSSGTPSGPLPLTLVAIPGIRYTCDATINAVAGVCNALNTTIASLYKSVFTNANANIYITFGNTNLGSSDTITSPRDYASFRNALIASVTGADDSTAVSKSVPASNPLGGGAVSLTNANARALGFVPARGIRADSTSCVIGLSTCFDGIVTLSSAVQSAQKFFFRTGSISSSQYDFYSVVEHETDEVLGTASCAFGCGGDFEPPDLFRYHSDGTRSFAPGNNNVACSSKDASNACFSIDGLNLLQQYNNLNDGNDAGDWQSDCQTDLLVQNKIACGGVAGLDISPSAEIKVLDVVGFTLTSNVGTPDLTIANTHTGNFTQGQVGAAYTITVANTGTGSSRGQVTVTDTLPAGLTATAMNGIGWSCTQPSGPCGRSDALAVTGAYPPILLTVNVAGNAPASLVNTATVSGGGETNTSNDVANDTTTVAQLLPSLRISKTHLGTFGQGQTGAAYTVIVTNSGAAATTGTVLVTEALPAGMLLTGMTGTGWACQSNTCVRSDALNVGVSYPAITVVVNVAANAAASLVNQATVSGGGSASASANDSTVVAASLSRIFDSTFFVAQQYLDLLDRAADSGGLAYWVNLLNTGQIDRSGVAGSFFNSPEFSQVGLNIIKYYIAVLGRDPDFSGWIFYFNQANVQHVPLSDILNTFLGSPEFQKTYGSLSNDAFVNLVYQNVLGRAPDAGGHDYWLGLLNTGQITRTQMMASFIAGGEFNNSVRPRAFANLLYMGFLRRTADASGLQFWTARLLDPNQLPTVIGGFITSTEYVARF